MRLKLWQRYSYLRITILRRNGSNLFATLSCRTVGHPVMSWVAFLIGHLVFLNATDWLSISAYTDWLPVFVHAPDWLTAGRRRSWWLRYTRQPRPRATGWRKWPRGNGAYLPWYEFDSSRSPVRIMFVTHYELYLNLHCSVRRKLLSFYTPSSMRAYSQHSRSQPAASIPYIECTVHTNRACLLLSGNLTQTWLKSAAIWLRIKVSLDMQEFNITISAPF